MKPPSGALRGARRLLAERLASIAGGIVGESVEPRPPRSPPDPGGALEAAAWAASLVLKARMTGSRAQALGELASWAASLVDEGEALNHLHTPGWPSPGPGRPGFWGLVSAAARHASRPSPSTAVDLLLAAASEAVKPCAADPGLERERARLERVMKLLGALLGLTLPALFLLSLLVDPAAALASLAAAVVVWGLIRAYGVAFRRVVVEASWARCALGEAEVRMVLEGRDLPSPAELVGSRLGEAMGAAPRASQR